MNKAFSNDPAAFLAEKNPVLAWEEMLHLEEKAAFREIMMILARNAERRDRNRQEEGFVFSLQYNSHKIVQRISDLPNGDQLRAMNQRLEEYELFLSDCVYKMHSQLNEFSPLMEESIQRQHSLEEDRSYELHQHLTGFEEKLMSRIGNLSLQIGKLGEGLSRLVTLNELREPLWHRLLSRLLRPLHRSPITLNKTLTERLERMNHSLVQDFARLGTLWRFYNQHEVLRSIGEAPRSTIVDFCKKTFWWEFKGGWTKENVAAFAPALAAAIQVYEAALAKHWEVIKRNIDSSLEVGVERQLDLFQMELHDIMVTLAKFQGHLEAMLKGEEVGESLKDLESLSVAIKLLTRVSKETDKFRKKVHPVLTALNIEVKRKVFAFVDMADDLPISGQEEAEFQQELANLLEAVDVYVDAIKDKMQRLLAAREKPSFQEKAAALQAEILDIAKVSARFQEAYARLLSHDSKLSEFFGGQIQDLNTARMQEIRRQLDHLMGTLSNK